MFPYSPHLPWLASITTDLPHQASYITVVLTRLGTTVSTAALSRCTHPSLPPFLLPELNPGSHMGFVSQLLSLHISATWLSCPGFHDLGTFELCWPVVLQNGFGFRLDCGCRIWKESQRWHAVYTHLRMRALSTCVKARDVCQPPSHFCVVYFMLGVACVYGGQRTVLSFHHRLWRLHSAHKA